MKNILASYRRVLRHKAKVFLYWIRKRRRSKRGWGGGGWSLHMHTYFFNRALFEFGMVSKVPKEGEYRRERRHPGKTSTLLCVCVCVSGVFPFGCAAPTAPRCVGFFNYRRWERASEYYETRLRPVRRRARHTPSRVQSSPGGWAVWVFRFPLRSLFLSLTISINCPWVIQVLENLSLLFLQTREFQNCPQERFK